MFRRLGCSSAGLLVAIAATASFAAAEETPPPSGEGRLLVHALNFYGGTVGGVVEVYLAAKPALAAPASPATPAPPSPLVRSHRRRVRHTTMPLIAPDAALAPPPPPPAAPPPPSLVLVPEGTPPPPEPPLARGAAGKPMTLPGGRYDILVNVGGAILRTPDVAVAPGREENLTVRFGALKVLGARAPVAVHDRDGNLVAMAAPYQTVTLPPGVYTLRKKGSTRSALTRPIQVKPGDIEVIELAP